MKNIWTNALALWEYRRIIYYASFAIETIFELKNPKIRTKSELSWQLALTCIGLDYKAVLYNVM